MLSTLLPNANATANDRIRKIINPKYRAIIEGRRHKGQYIILTNIYLNVTKGSLSPDGIHPTDVGYKDMALVWYKAVDKVIGEDIL
ncbi:GDSL-like lipase acylhydrolase [Paraphaeosphaeria sporulosa]